MTIQFNAKFIREASAKHRGETVGTLDYVVRRTIAETPKTTRISHSDHEVRLILETLIEEIDRRLPPPASEPGEITPGCVITVDLIGNTDPKLVTHVRANGEVCTLAVADSDCLRVLPFHTMHPATPEQVEELITALGMDA
ncbi:hypothetical protein ACSMXM_05655 [Pacificimonas sp. ICDLI1SI03]